MKHNQQDKIAKRRAAYCDIASKLALMGNKRLLEIVQACQFVNSSIGGEAGLLTIDDTTIFIKKIRLTDLERYPDNIMSTANLFNLPGYFQYGIGSPGFGVWRELAAHSMSTNWVLSGECLNFPLMYHWRLLPRHKATSLSSEELKALEDNVKYWDGSPEIRARFEANLTASANIVLFMEYIPENLHQWLRKEIAQGGKAADTALKLVESSLQTMVTFMKSRGLIHFDAHFENILTDGQALYLTDFGLATSSQFELSAAEVEFFKKHYNYDECSTMAFLVKWLLIELFGIKHYDMVLHEYANGRGRKELSPTIIKIISRYSPIALELNNFYKRLRKAKTTKYPICELEKACIAARL